MINISPQTDS